MSRIMFIAQLVEYDNNKKEENTIQCGFESIRIFEGFDRGTFPTYKTNRCNSSSFYGIVHFGRRKRIENRMAACLSKHDIQENVDKKCINFIGEKCTF